MEAEKSFKLRFNQILFEEMGKIFDLKPLPLDQDFKLKYSDKKDKSTYIKSDHVACPKTAGIRTGELDLQGSMLIQFGNVPPAKDYDIPILGYTFVYSNKCLIVVLDLLPISRDREYTDKYIAPLKEISQKYEGIPRVEGSRSEVAEWAKAYDSGFSIYLWCDKKYVPDMEQAFREYIHVFCNDISKAEPLTDQDMIANRGKYVSQYINDYLANDTGGAPLRSYFGADWGERYMKDFFFAP
jgi:hypothetical protein